MKLRAVKIRNIRNLSSVDCDLGEGLNVIYGKNGQGKTSFLEALYLALSLRSFRTRQLQEVLTFDAVAAQVSIQKRDAASERQFSVLLERTEKSVRKKLSVDGKVASSTARYFEEARAVLFSAEDMLVIRGEPSARRRFLDRSVFNDSPEHLPVVNAYEKVLKARNSTLRNDHMSFADKSMLLDVYDQQLAAAGAKLFLARSRFVERLARLFAEHFGQIAGADLVATVTYQSGLGLDPDASAGESQEVFLHKLAGSRSLDLARQLTSSGPHRDDVLFSVGGREAADFASQGQTRAAILAWKTAELMLAKVKKESLPGHPTEPLLLLDDVSSELDPEKTRYLFEFIAQIDCQCVVTTTDPGFIPPADSRRDFGLAGGVLT